MQARWAGAGEPGGRGGRGGVGQAGVQELLAAQVLAGVHAQAARAAAEAVALGAVLAGVAVLAVELAFVLSAVGGVQHLVAHSAFEAHLVELEAASDLLLGRVHGLAAFRAFGVFNWLERHLGLSAFFLFRYSLGSGRSLVALCEPLH